MSGPCLYIDARKIFGPKFDENYQVSTAIANILSTARSPRCGPQNRLPKFLPNPAQLRNGCRWAGLMALVKAEAYQRRYRRLAGCLLGHGTVLNVTHQALAHELDTVREIVTRLLKRFKHAGRLVDAREQVRVLDATALRSLAAGRP